MTSLTRETDPLDQTATLGRLVTSEPHTHSPQKAVVVRGAEPDGFNGIFAIRDIASDTELTFKMLADPGAEEATGEHIEIGVGHSSQFVAIAAISVEDKGTGGPPVWIATVVTKSPHRRTLRHNARLIVGSDPSGPFTGGFAITAIDSPTEFRCRLRYAEADPPYVPENLTGAYLGPIFQVGAGGTTTLAFEGNHISNCQVGAYTDTGSSKDLTIRNNHFYNVQVGVFHSLGGANPAEAGSALVRDPRWPTRAIFTCIIPHGLNNQQQVTINGAVTPALGYDNPYNATKPITRISAAAFSYEMDADPGTNALGSPVFEPLPQGMGQVLSGTVERDTQAGIAVFRTADHGPHGFSAGEWVTVFGVVVNGSVFNSFNGVFQE